MKITKIIRRFFIPGIFVSIYGFIKFRSMISPKAEVELTNLYLGSKVEIGSFCKIKTSRGPLRMGNNVIIATGSFLSSSKKELILGDNVIICPNCVILSNKHNTVSMEIPFSKAEKKATGTTIESNVLIGAGSVVLDGTVIGEGSLISANSVVSGKIPKYSFVAGNPAKVIFNRQSKNNESS